MHLCEIAGGVMLRLLLAVTAAVPFGCGWNAHHSCVSFLWQLQHSLCPVSLMQIVHSLPHLHPKMSLFIGVCTSLS